MRIPEGSDDIAYLKANLDVARAVEDEIFSSGWEHYSLCGMEEGRDVGFVYVPEYKKQKMTRKCLYP